ncbi:hypothetical protein O3P69_002012 [Scylla paramamosain]|uniref:Uncharacterized protein n=1 Tax=Scylla paramamosain TaxID=85552 RepID=A0AAW0V6F3_SCYPA
MIRVKGTPGARHVCGVKLCGRCGVRGINWLDYLSLEKHRKIPSLEGEQVRGGRGQDTRNTFVFQTQSQTHGRREKQDRVKDESDDGQLDGPGLEGVVWVGWWARVGGTQWLAAPSCSNIVWRRPPPPDVPPSTLHEFSNPRTVVRHRGKPLTAKH